jgi:hypothetical protein
LGTVENNSAVQQQILRIFGTIIYLHSPNTLLQQLHIKHNLYKPNTAFVLGAKLANMASHLSISSKFYSLLK